MFVVSLRVKVSSVMMLRKHVSLPLAVSMAVMAAGVVLLFLGGMLYVLYRPQSLLLFRVADGMGLTDAIGGWRHAAAPFAPAEFVVYNLPAGLWALSYVLIVGTLAQGLPSVKRWVAVAFVPLVGVVSELMQAARLLPGIFDWIDLALYAAPLALYAVYYIIINNNEQTWQIFSPASRLQPSSSAWL